MMNVKKIRRVDCHSEKYDNKLLKYIGKSFRLPFNLRKSMLICRVKIDKDVEFCEIVFCSFVCIYMYMYVHTYTHVAYLQLSISIWHSCRSIGKYCKFMGHDAVIVKLKHIQVKPV